MGRPTGILVLKYFSDGLLEFGEARHDLVHQFYWSPDGLLATRHGADAGFVGSAEVFWAQRAVSHEVHAADRQTVYRVCLRQLPPALATLRAGTATIDDEAVRLLTAIARRGYDEGAALLARERILAGLGATVPEFTGHRVHHATGHPGFALSVARALSRDPGDDTRLDEWAAGLHISVKTLQRDFEREFGMSFSRWRARLRLRASRVLLQSRPVTEVAHRVGYASPSAFVAAFAREYGHTPGGRTRRTVHST